MTRGNHRSSLGAGRRAATAFVISSAISATSPSAARRSPSGVMNTHAPFAARAPKGAPCRAARRLTSSSMVTCRSIGERTMPTRVEESAVLGVQQRVTSGVEHPEIKLVYPLRRYDWHAKPAGLQCSRPRGTAMPDTLHPCVHAPQQPILSSGGPELLTKEDRRAVSSGRRSRASRQCGSSPQNPCRARCTARLAR
jgi:hypothetical protein